MPGQKGRLDTVEKEVLHNDQPQAGTRSLVKKYRLTQAFERLPENSLARNLRRTFLRIAVVLLFIGIIGTGSLIYSNSATSDLLNRLEPLISYNNGMLVQVLDMNTDVRNYLRTGESSYISLYQSDKQSYQRIFQNASALLSSSERASNILQNENSSTQSLFSTYELTALAVPPGQLSSQRIDEVLVGINQHLQNYRNSYEVANIYLTKERTAALHRLGILVFVTTAITIMAVLIALILGFRRAIIARLRIQNLLGRITDTLSRLEVGEAHVRAPLTGLIEERVLATAINSMAEQKEALIAELEKQYEQEKELREGLELERTLREGLSNTLYRDLDVASALQRTVNGLGPALRADRALVRIMENSSPGTIISEWLSPAVSTTLDTKVGPMSVGDLRTSVYLQPGPIRESMRNGSVIAINDVASDERLSEETRAAVIRTGLGAFLTAPVVGAMGTEAVLVAAMEGHARNWTDRDVQVAQTMASGLAATLTAIRLYEQERTNLVAMKKLDESKDFFLASVSHELRTPLTSIVGYLELLQEEMEEGKISYTYSRMLDAIDRNSKRLIDLIENILTASRIESGNLQLSKSRTHITPILMRAAETVMPQVNSKHIDLKINVSDRLPDLEIDAHLIERVILNVISNAIKFTPDGGTISIAAFSESKSVAVAVSDSGTGIEPDELEKLFTKFYRTSAARENAVQGTGLGLVIVKAIIEQHGGSVSLTSRVGEGTTFTILLPTVESDALHEDSGSVAESRPG